MDRSIRHDHSHAGNRGRLRRMVVGVLALLAAPGATPSEYALELVAGEAAAFQLELDPQHAGPLVVDADWSGRRVVSFKLTGPDGRTVRRSGPPPQRLEVRVDPRDGPEDGLWRLSIVALAQREEGRGTLRVKLPGPQPADPPVQPAISAAIPPPATPASDPRTVRRDAPPGSPPERIALFEAIERFRGMILEGHETRADACGWQHETLRYLGQARDTLGTAGAVPDTPTREMLERLVAATAGVEALRISQDPILAGPPPTDPWRQRAWNSVREERLLPLELELDRVLDALHRGHAPALASWAWPQRFVSCITACERHFVERPIHGAAKAAHHDLVQDQWDRILAGAAALGQLLALPPT